MGVRVSQVYRLSYVAVPGCSLSTHATQVSRCLMLGFHGGFEAQGLNDFTNVMTISSLTGSGLAISQ